MPFFKKHPPKAMYRGAILLACLAFLLGVSGIFYFRHLDTRDLPPSGMASVLVHGLEGEADIEVVAEWIQRESARGAASRQDAGAELNAETARPSEDAGVYLFRHAPEGVPLELIVYRVKQGRRVELHRQLAVLTYGQSIYTAISRGALESPAGAATKGR